MNYIMIRTDDMLNGNGLRVVLFCTACDHYCHNCHNPETWQASNGILFDDKAKKEIFEELDKDYISGITLSGGDPLNVNNRFEIRSFCEEIKNKYPSKTIWLYTGYTWEEISSSRELMKTILNVDVIVDGEFKQDLADVNYPWAGSLNQRVIDVQKSLKQNKVVLWHK